jgi:hypothetical protein
VREDEKYAVGAFGNMFAIWMHDADFLDCIAECKWSINGQIEDCLNDYKEVRKNIKM